MVKKNTLLSWTIIAGMLLLFQNSALPAGTYATLSGTVSRDNGLLALFTPLPGAVVYLELPLDYSQAANQYSDIAARQYSIYDSAVTDNNGNFILDSIPPQSYLIRTVKKGYLTAQSYVILTKDTSVNIRLTALTTFYRLTGKVTRDCPLCSGLVATPLQNCTVSVWIPSNVFLTGSRWQYAGTAVSDAGGLYKIDSIPAESGADLTSSAMIIASKDGFIADTGMTLFHINKTDSLNLYLIKISTATLQHAQLTFLNSAAVLYNNNTGVLSFVVDRKQPVSVTVYRPDGSFVSQLFSGRLMNTGRNAVIIDKKLFGPGTYMFRISGINFNRVTKISLF